MPRQAGARLVAAIAAAGTATVITMTLLASAKPAPPDGSATPTVTTPARASAAVSGVDLGDRAAVCDAFAAALSTADTAADAGPEAAYSRAAGHATTGLASSLVPARARWQADWQELGTHRGRVTTETSSPAGQPPPLGRTGTAHHAAVVNATASGPGGWNSPTRRHVVYCTLLGAGPRWQMAGYGLERLP